MGTVKLFLPSFIFILLFSCSPKTASQLTKQEEQQWKQQKNAMSPEQFKNIVEEAEVLKQDHQAQVERVTELQESLERKDNEIQRLSTLLTQSQKKVSTLENERLSDKNRDDSEWDKGVVFRVQLAAFDDYDLRNMVQQGSDLDIIDEDGYIKYILGQFRDYDEANLFKKKLRKIGVREAWIVPYKDGKRVPLKEVLDQVIN